MFLVTPSASLGFPRGQDANETSRELIYAFIQRQGRLSLQRQFKSNANYIPSSLQWIDDAHVSIEMVEI